MINKRLAKRWACSRVAMAIGTIMETVPESLDDLEQVRCCEALTALQAELNRRGLTVEDGIKSTMEEK